MTSSRFVFLFAILLTVCASVACASVVSRGQDGDLHVPAPRTWAWSRLFGRQTDAASLWNITYEGTQPPDYVKAAVSYATELITKFLIIRVPIRAQFTFSSLGSNAQGNQILGQARSAVWWPVQNATQSLPIALANTLAGFDMIADWTQQVDIIASFNSDAPFYYATDDSRPPSGNFDFVTVLIHELLHGMGFIGGFACRDPCDPNTPLLAVPYVFKEYLPSFDTRIINAGGTSMSRVWQSKSSLGLADFYATSSRLYLRTDAEDVELFAPHPYLQGNSLYHLAERYNSGGDSLMRYAISARDVIHSLGPATLNVMQSIGWQLHPEAINIARQASSSATYVPSLLLVLAIALSLELYFLYLS